MHRSIRFIMVIMFVMAFCAVAAFGQVQFSFPIHVQGAAATDTGTVAVGVNEGINTYAPDLLDSYGAYKEFLAPPAPPSGWDFWVGFFDIPNRTEIGTVSAGTGMKPYDFRGSIDIDTFYIRVTGNTVANGNFTMTWPANLSSVLQNARLLRRSGTNWVSAVPDMLTGSSYTQDNSGGNGTYNYLLIFLPKVTVVGPSFSLSPSSLCFSAGPGTTASQTVTVTNSGTSQLNISGVTFPANFSVTPTTADIAAGGNQIFTVTFNAPSTDGTYAGNVVFTHNASGSPSNLAVSGTVQSQSGVLQFANPAPSRKDNTTGYTDSLQLINYNGKPLQSLQFRIITNVAPSNGNLLILRSVERGSDIPANKWSFNSQIVRGIANSAGAGSDTVTVVIYGIGRGDTLFAGHGNYLSLVKFSYDVVDIADPDLQTVRDSIANVASSIPIFGTSAGVSAGVSQVVTVTNRTMYGDVNNDNHVDILDLLMVVDHILGRDTLTTDEFSRADIAPWLAGSSAPTPDNIVDVRDLSVIQGIILYNQYPDNSRLSKMAPYVVASRLSKSTAETKITFSVTKNSIAIRLNSKVQVRAIQFSLRNVNSISQVSSVVSEVLPNSAALLSGTTLRSVLYAQTANSLAPGNTLVAVINLPITEEAEVEVEEVIVADVNNRPLGNVEWEIMNKEDISVPSAFRLDQNYPNPFNPTTTITFSVPQTSAVRLTIYNLLGQEVRTLFAGQMDKGTQTLSFDGKDQNGRALSSGTYMYRMTAGSFVETKKMVLMK